MKKFPMSKSHWDKVNSLKHHSQTKGNSGKLPSDIWFGGINAVMVLLCSKQARPQSEVNQCKNHFLVMLLE